MKLSEWRKSAQGRKFIAGPRLAVLNEALAGVGAGVDPEAFVDWTDDPENRITVLAAAEAGMATVNVRAGVGPEGARASARLLRWGRVQASELNAEVQGGHRLVTCQLESMVLKGGDADADAVAEWITHVYLRIDGRIPLETSSATSAAGGRGAARKRPDGQRSPRGRSASGRASTALTRTDH